MIGDGTCNEACLTTECDYDSIDCGCSPGCTFSMYGNCDFLCLVPDCAYDDCWRETNQIMSFGWQMLERKLDTAFNFDRDCLEKAPLCSFSVAHDAVQEGRCASDCEPCVHAFGTCFTGYNEDSCEWGYGPNYGDCILCVDRQIYTFCTSRCPRAMPEYPTFEWICYPAKDTSTPTARDSIYVTNTASGGNEGTYSDPYFVLSTAFAQNFMAYSTIYLLAGSHDLTKVDTSVPEGVLVTDPTQPLQNTFNNVMLTVTTLFCSSSEDHSECATSKAAIHIVAFNVSFTVKYFITFDKVIIDGKNSLVPGCTDVLCYYCADVFVDDSGALVDDRGDPIDPAAYAKQTICDLNHNTPIFSVTSAGTLILSDVDITNIRYQPKAIIFNSGGIISLTQVNFKDIIVASNGAVIRQDVCGTPPYGCGSLSYSIGTVSYLNNGYEAVDTLELGGFISADGFKDITIASVTFKTNIALNPKENSASAGLLSFKNFRSLTIDGCTFQDNIVTTLISVKALTLSLLKTVDALNNVIDFAIEHFYIKSSIFSKNLAVTSLITTVHVKDLQNFKIQDSTFTDNFTLKSAMILLQYSGKLTTEMTVGQTKAVAMPSGSKVSGYFAPHHVQVLSSSFVRNIGISLFDLTNVANVAFTADTTFSENGSSHAEACNDVVMDQFIRDADAYLKNRLVDTAQLMSPCERLLSLSSCVSVTLSQLVFSKNICENGPAGIVAKKLGSTVTFTSVQFSENMSNAEDGAVVRLEDRLLPIEISDVTFTSNKNTNSLSTGMVALGASMTVSLNNCKFTGNQAASGGAIYAEDLVKLVVASTSFENNVAAEGSGGAITVVPGSGATQYLFEVSGCSFKGNQSTLGRGGAVFFSSDNLTRPYKVKITSTSFTANIAATMGSAIYIDSTLALSSDSSVQQCSFASNKSAKGTVAVYYSAGQLSVAACAFIQNQAKAGAGIASTTQPNATLSVSESSFTNNASPGGVVALTDPDIVKTLFSSNCSFQNNAGVAVYVQNGKWTDYKSSFTNTSGSAVFLADGAVASITEGQFAGNAAASNGGAAYIASGSTLKCTKCTFSKNTSEDKGGALFLEQSSKIQITDSSFDSNTCKDKGAAIFLLGSLTPVSTISSSSFTNNAADNSGVISLLSSALALTSVTINSNTAKGTSPGIVMNLSTLTVKTSTFSNQTGKQGGFVYATTESSATFTDSSFSAATAQSGGAFNIIGSTLALTGCKLSSLTAISGAGFIAYSQSSISLTRVTMFSMTASDSAIGFISEGSLTITDSSFQYFGSGGVQGDKLTSAFISYSSFSDGSGVLGGGFTCTRCQSVFIQFSTFHRNTANWGGGIYLTTQSDALIDSIYQVEFTTFSNNSAWRGAGAYSNNVNLLYSNCSFVYNNASKPEDKSLQATGDWGRGGGAMADCKDVAKCNFNFTLSYFARNWAEVSGGGIAWQDVRPSLLNCTFLSNAAEYANDISSFAVALKQMTSERKLQSIVLSGIASGQDTTQSLVVALVDHYGGIVTTDNSSSAEIVAVDPLITTLAGITKVTAVRGVFTFDKFIISAEPGTTAMVRVQTSAIDTSKAVKAQDSFVYAPAISISAEMRSCVLGESHVGKNCQVCEPGKYSLNPNSTSCSNCPAEAICYGNYTMVPRAGYWRARVDTDVFYKCLFSDACVGSPEPPAPLSLTGECATGYQSNLCQSCSKGFSRNKKYECATCPDESSNIVRLVFIAIAVAILAGVMVSTTMKSARKEKSLASIYIKILMNYLQIVILAASFNLGWPDQVVQLFSMQETAGSFAEQAFSVDCFLAPDAGSPGETIVYNKLVAMAIVPLFITLAAVFAWLLIFGYKGHRKFPKDGFIATVIILLFLAHPTLTKYLFNIFTCMDVDGEFYLLQQLEVKCWDSKHVFYISACAVPAIILWVLGIPAVCLSYLVRNKRQLSRIHIRIRLGFLFNGYRSKAYYWEFVILYRKILIICCSVFLTTISIPIQALCVMLVLITSMYLQDLVRPFTTQDLNSMELKSILCASVTIYCGLFYLTGDLGSSAKLVLFVAIVVVNAFFLWHWVRNTFGFCITLIVNKIPFLRRRIGDFHRVKDGLDEDLFVRRRYLGFFMSSLTNEVTPMVNEDTSHLYSMKDMYLMKLRHMNAISKLEENLETDKVTTLADSSHYCSPRSRDTLLKEEDTYFFRQSEDIIITEL